MVAITTSSKLFTLLLVAAHALALTPDPSGASKIGNGQHQSSVGSQCASSLDCGANGNTACCAFLPQADGQAIGICSGCGATTQQGKQGCGFGDQGKDVAGTPQVCAASSFAQGAASGSASAAVAAASSSSFSRRRAERRAVAPLPGVPHLDAQ